jgi:hypothetical protein
MSKCKITCLVVFIVFQEVGHYKVTYLTGAYCISLIVYFC